MLRFNILSTLGLAGFIAIAVSASTQVRARPPEGVQKAEAPLVGRARTRHGVVDLTRFTVAEGGAAHELAKGLAQVEGRGTPTAAQSPLSGVIADAEVARNDRTNLPAPAQR